MVQPKYHVFVCTSCRMNGQQRGFCYAKNAVDIVETLMEEIEARDLSGDVVVNNTGCFGICDKGPIIVVYPEGIWYGNVSQDDVERIVEEHFEKGIPVSELII